MKKAFVASSRRFYDQVKDLKAKLDKVGVVAFYPYFEFGDGSIEDNPRAKAEVTRQHFPEIDKVDVLYIVAPGGYVGYSVTIEVSYAFAKGKEILSSEPIQELAVRALVSRVMAGDEFLKYVCR